MPLETGTYTSDLNASNPLGTDLKSTLDNQIRWVKSAILATWPNVTGAVTTTHTNLNKVGVTQSPGDNTTSPASTAFVQAAIASVNAQTALTLSNVSGTTQTAAAGSMYVLQGAACLVTFPAAPTTGDTIGIAVGNNLLTNSFDLNGKTLTGANGANTGVIVINYVGVPVFKYLGATTQWMQIA